MDQKAAANQSAAKSRNIKEETQTKDQRVRNHQRDSHQTSKRRHADVTSSVRFPDTCTSRGAFTLQKSAYRRHEENRTEPNLSWSRDGLRSEEEEEDGDEEEEGLLQREEEEAKFPDATV